MSKESKEINALQSGESFPEADVVLDASGLYCPEPVMLIHNKIRDMNESELLEVIATDPSTTRDIPKFCIYLDHELLSQTESEGKFVYLIRKKKG